MPDAGDILRDLADNDRASGVVLNDGRPVMTDAREIAAQIARPKLYYAASRPVTCQLSLPTDKPDAQGAPAPSTDLGGPQRRSI